MAMGFTANVLTFIFSIPRKFYNFKTLMAVITLPKAFILMFLSLLKVRGANKSLFILNTQVTNLIAPNMKIGIEGQRLFRVKKHGMDMVALELINHLQAIDHENEYVVFVKPDEDKTCLEETKNFKLLNLQEAPTLPGSNLRCQRLLVKKLAIFCIALVIQLL